MSNKKTGHYPRHRAQAVPSSPVFAQMEAETLDYWRTDNTFQASIDMRPAGKGGDNEFVFYDGPPFANGLPHYGHLLTGYVKDVIGRYQTQLGHRVERRFGWDTHGLPAEIEAERILGIEDKSQIEGEGGVGIAQFNECCRTSVLRYTDEWENYVTRQARWVDFNNDYKTLEPDYMESVIWAFKRLYDQGLAYEGYRVLPYCWNDQTPLSNHELKMDDDVYQERQDNTVTVGLRLETGELALIWTTTPWTLPSNLAIAVGPQLEYVALEIVPGQGLEQLAGQTVIIASELVESYRKELGDNPIVKAKYLGSELVGRAYTPIFDYFEGREKDQAPSDKAWHIIAADFVTVADGTGLVHMAPAFGEDDMNVCNEAGIIPVVPVDEAGKFTSEVSDYAQMQVFEANRYIVSDLRNSSGALARRDKSIRAVLVKEQSYAHSYPHCWRCRQPLIYRAVSSWFVKVSAIRDRMVELNQGINWVPEHIKDGQFGKWLAGARDWSISRNRFWGAPIPVWVSDDPNYPRVDVYGSFAELERDFGVEVRDLHRPFIDTLVRPNPDDPSGKSCMRRIPDVLDCWFESGSMPFAQVHYPFENRDWFESHYPGDFIVEYIGQTRGWFYTLHVLATALFDRPAFTNCVSHGIVLGDDGRKMSKSLRNYPDVNLVFDRYGSDAMRWFLMASPIVRGGNLVVTESGIRDTVRQVLLPLWNTYYFFTLYAGTCAGGSGYQAQLLALDNADEVAGLDVMDRYLLASTRDLTNKMRQLLDSYEIAGTCQAVREYLDMLTNWYVRNSRQRFWDEDHQAFDTLYTALEALMRAIAPLTPLLSEQIWRGLTGGRSVHLQDYPQFAAVCADNELVAAMDEIREVVSAAHGLRKSQKLRVRLPLASLTVVCADPQALRPFGALVAAEVNVKQVEFITPSESGLRSELELALNPKQFDPDVRKLTSALFAAQKASQWQVEVDETGADTVVFPQVLLGGEPVRLHADAFSVSVQVQAQAGTAAAVLASGSFVVLDTEVTAQLEAEGYARDLVRCIQDARKAKGLHVADRISLQVVVPERYLEWVQAPENFAMIMSETLATSFDLSAAPVKDPQVTVTKMDQILDCDSICDVDTVNKAAVSLDLPEAISDIEDAK